MKAPSFDAKGAKAGDVELAAEFFDVQINVPVMHEVVRAELAAGRSGTASTKTRAEVRGGGRKPWRQKGTGRARAGSIRQPQWVGGGVAHGPKPKDFSFRVNRKARSLALRSALTDRAREGQIKVVTIPDFDEPETKAAMQLLDKWGVGKKTLLVVGRKESNEKSNAWKSFRNLPAVQMMMYATPYWVINADTVVFTQAALAELMAEKPAEKPEEGPAAAETAPDSTEGGQ